MSNELLPSSVPRVYLVLMHLNEGVTGFTYSNLEIWPWFILLSPLLLRNWCWASSLCIYVIYFCLLSGRLSLILFNFPSLCLVQVIYCFSFLEFLWGRFSGQSELDKLRDLQSISWALVGLEGTVSWCSCKNTSRVTRLSVMRKKKCLVQSH